MNGDGELSNRLMTHSVNAMFLFFFSSRRRHTRCSRDWSSDVCSSDLGITVQFGVKVVVPLKLTECTVALRLKMIVSGMLKLSHHGIFTVPAPVQLHGAVLTGV